MFYKLMKIFPFGVIKTNMMFVFSVLFVNVLYIFGFSWVLDFEHLHDLVFEFLRVFLQMFLWIGCYLSKLFLMVSGVEVAVVAILIFALLAANLAEVLQPGGLHQNYMYII